MSGNHQCFSSDLYKKCYFVKISQSKNRHIYSIVGKKTGRHIGKECQCFHRKINEIASSVFNWFCNQNDLLSQNYFLISKYQNKFQNNHLTFATFLNIIYYWNKIDKKIVDDYFKLYIHTHFCL